MKKLFAAIFSALLIIPQVWAENAKTVDFLAGAQKSGMTFYWDPLTASGLI